MYFFFVKSKLKDMRKVWLKGYASWLCRGVQPIVKFLGNFQANCYTVGNKISHGESTYTMEFGKHYK